MGTKVKPSKNILYRMILSAMFLALALVLPFLTGQIPQIGKALCPMHVPVLLCGFFCGPWYALGIGFAAPLIRFLLFGMPVLVPTGVSMCFELAAYGVLSGILYYVLPKKKYSIYIALIGAMISGRVVWGCVQVVMLGLGITDFGWKAFIAGAFVNSIPGIVVQIVIIPILVMALGKYTYNADRQ